MATFGLNIVKTHSLPSGTQWMTMEQSQAEASTRRESQRSSRKLGMERCVSVNIAIASDGQHNVDQNRDPSRPTA